MGKNTRLFFCDKSKSCSLRRMMKSSPPALSKDLASHAAVRKRPEARPRKLRAAVVELSAVGAEAGRSLGNEQPCAVHPMDMWDQNLSHPVHRPHHIIASHLLEHPQDLQGRSSNKMIAAHTALTPALIRTTCHLALELQGLYNEEVLDWRIRTLPPDSFT